MPGWNREAHDSSWPPDMLAVATKPCSEASPEACCSLAACACAASSRWPGAAAALSESDIWVLSERGMVSSMLLLRMGASASFLKDSFRRSRWSTTSVGGCMNELRESSYNATATGI